MSISEILQSDGWKSFMAKLYGLGAAVVIVGAMFKIMHWPGAGPMLVVGLTTEAIIFFFSAFEPRHEELDWSLVYPQLAGLEDGEATTVTSHEKGGSSSGLSKLDELLLKSVDNGDELFAKLGKGLENLSKTTSSLSDISKAAVATNDYTTSVKNAADSISSLTKTYNHSADAINLATSGLTDSYLKTADQISEAGNTLTLSYSKLATSIETDQGKWSTENKAYGKNIETINKNLSALNAVYELQLQSNSERFQASEKLFGGMDEVMANLKSSIQLSQNYKQEFEKLGQKLTALNQVYGNMLTAMNVKI